MNFNSLAADHTTIIPDSQKSEKLFPISAVTSLKLLGEPWEQKD
jgi:hypothetical protein